MEGQTHTGVFTNRNYGSVIRRSRDGGHTWTEAIRLPPQWGASEGALARARDGALVVSLRTGPEADLESFNDHWRRIRLARSMDDGMTWTDHQVHFRYGKVHTEMITLRNGDILLTYAARMGELEGKMYHGIEAVLSHDNGKTWDWDKRFILFRWAMHQSMHSPVSLELSDGRIMTVLMFIYDAPWNEGSFSSSGLAMTSVIFWSPYPDEKSN